jgi:hypothetical protein
MATTNNTYTGNGSNKLFTITFPYLETTDVKVYVNNSLTTAYTFANATTIEFTTAPASGAVILIQRDTYNETNNATFFAGSSIRAADLNDNFDQALYIRQEIFDTTWDNNTQTTNSTETWTSVDTQVATTQAIDQRIDYKIDTALISDVFGSDGVSITDNTPGSGQITVGLSAGSVDLDRIKDADIITTTEQDAGTPSWTSDDTKVSTIGAAAKRFDTIVQAGTPSGSNWQVGKTWLQNDVNNTLSIWNGSGWLGVASGGTFTTQPTVIYVDSVNGNDANDGHRIINPKKTIKNAVASASAGDTIKVAPGVYQESLPIDITVANLSIVGEAQRSCFINPTVATETQIMFRCNSGTYIDGFTFAGLKASGVRGGHAIDSDATYGLPAAQGWVAGFLPGCVIRKSPYINNSTNFADSGINNAAFDPNNYQGTGGDLTSGPAGGGIIVDGSLPDVNSPLRSFVVNEFTQVCLDGPGLLVCNNGYAQAVSFFGLFCHYHAKALSGGQINMEVGTTDFGRYGLIADGKSTAPIFTATSNGSATAAAVTFAINAPTAGGTWFGDANRPAINMLAEVTVSGTTYLYPILSSGVNGSGWNVTISRPNPSNRSENLGLNVTVPSGTQWRFYLRSLVSTASHTMEYAGSGTNYTALPENGGVAIEANEAINRNGGKVWLTSTDQSGKFKVGDTFAVDQQTGYVTIDPQSVAINVVSDLSPELGGDLDVLARNIYSSVGDIGIQDAFNTGVNLMLVRESSLATAYPVVTQYDIGTDPNQVPLNGYLGTMAFQDAAGVNIDLAAINTATISSAAISSATITAITADTTIFGVKVGRGGGAISSNTAVGAVALNVNTTGSDNTAIGNAALVSNTTGNSNTVVGSFALYSNTTGVKNTALGWAALYSCSTGNNNTANGIQALSSCTGSNNIALGYQAGLSLTTGSNNTIIGSIAGTAGLSDTVIIGAGSTEKLRISSGGVLSGPSSFAFPATQVASADPNTLDDYEEGTWTAAITAAGGGSQTYTMTSATASYTKIGNVVHLFGRLEWTYAAGGSPSSACLINLPINAGGDTSYRYRSSSFVGTSNTAGVLLSRESATSATFFSNMSGGGAFFYLTYMIGP